MALNGACSQARLIGYWEGYVRSAPLWAVRSRKGKIARSLIAPALLQGDASCAGWQQQPVPAAGSLVQAAPSWVNWLVHQRRGGCWLDSWGGKTSASLHGAARQRLGAAGAVHGWRTEQLPPPQCSAALGSWMS